MIYTQILECTEMHQFLSFHQNRAPVGFCLFISKMVQFLKMPMKRNFSFFLTKEHKKVGDCRLPFLNILFGSGVTKL